MSFEIINLTPEFKDKLIKSGGWDDKCPVDISRLVRIKIAHMNFERQIKTGELLIFDVVAESAINVFKSLLLAEFPINSVNLLDIFDYNDEKTMKANNSSCFNNRYIADKNSLSLHAYGLAIDINPLQNPVITYKKSNEYSAELSVSPEQGRNFMNRIIIRPGMVEPIVEIFFKNGFDIWGGLWADPIDYHHFQVDRSLAEQLAKVSYQKGLELWQEHLKQYS